MTGFDEMLVSDLRRAVLTQAAGGRDRGPLSDAVRAVLEGEISLHDLASLDFLHDELEDAASSALEQHAEYRDHADTTTTRSAYQAAAGDQSAA